MTEFFSEFGLRDWLLVLGPVLVVGILIHGYWRMRVGRNSLKMSLDKSFVSDLNDSKSDDSDELSLLRAELPNGGARVLSPTVQTSLNLDDDVPVLMDVAEGQKVDLPETEPQTSSEMLEPISDEIDETSHYVENDVPVDLPEDLPEKYVVINVMAVNEPFRGQELLECLVEQDMSIGEMNIFHRHHQDKEQTLFSLMNAVEPGSFDMATIGEMSTPAISMFMRVHELHTPIKVFEQMLAVAQNISEALGGEVRDESRSVMTTQTIEHCRQEIEEYVFKYHP